MSPLSSYCAERSATCRPADRMELPLTVTCDSPPPETRQATRASVDRASATCRDDMDRKLRRRVLCASDSVKTMTVVQDTLEGISLLQVEGPLRTPVNSWLLDEVEARLFRGERRLVINLAGVTDIDAAGVGELARAYNVAAAAGATLRITHATRRVRVVLQRLGLFELLNEDA